MVWVNLQSEKCIVKILYRWVEWVGVEWVKWTEWVEWAECWKRVGWVGWAELIEQSWANEWLWRNIVLDWSPSWMWNRLKSESEKLKGINDGLRFRWKVLQKYLQLSSHTSESSKGQIEGKTIAKTKNCKSKIGSGQLHGKTAKVNGERRNSILVVWTKYFSPK